jgi:Family of unknown function (DUF6448)
MTTGPSNINHVLIWVRPQDADEIKRVFQETLAVRKLSPQAQSLADQHFFETLVRIHRTGENAPYTGLKPAGRDLGPAIPAADKTIETGSDKALIELLTNTAWIRSSVSKGAVSQTPAATKWCS